MEVSRNLWQSSKAVGKSSEIDQFRYIKIQPKTVDLSMRLWGITRKFVGFIPQQPCSQGLSSFFRNPGNEVDSPEPHTEVYCVSLRLNFNISRMVYSGSVETKNLAHFTEKKLAGIQVLCTE